jgi:hypothetical protein
LILFVLVTLLVSAFIIGGVYFFDEALAPWGALLVVILTIFFWWLSFGTEHTETIKVADKERIAEGEGGKWVIYGADDQTYENTDAWYHGKSDSTNLQRKIKVGQTYKCKVNGVRFTVLSWYKNILSCERV